MNDAKMTAEERVGKEAQPALHFYNSTMVVMRSDAIRIANEHAAAVAEVAKERDALRVRVRVRHREDQEWVTKQLAQVYPWWQKECQEREVARQDALAARRERDEHRTRAEQAEARVAELEAEVERIEAARASENELRNRYYDQLNSERDQHRAEVERLRVLRPWAEPYVPLTMLAVEKAFSLAELMHTRDVQIVLDTQMRAMAVSLAAKLEVGAREKELEAEVERLREALLDAQGFAQCECGHPHCRRCAATRDISAALAPQAPPARKEGE